MAEYDIKRHVKRIVKTGSKLEKFGIPLYWKTDLVEMDLMLANILNDMIKKNGGVVEKEEKAIMVVSIDVDVIGYIWMPSKS